MSRKTGFLCALAVLFASLAITAAGAEEALVSSPDMIFDAKANHDGIAIAAAGVPGKRYTEDYAPSQVLEIIRPGDGPIAVGRLITSCPCLSASMEKREFGQGERAFIEVRTVKAPPMAGAKYAVIAQLTAPQRTALQFDYLVP